jgi:lysophospholipase L1-like esterase
VVFGDSYSQVPRANFPNWVTQLQSAGVVGASRNFAKSGATAAKIGTNHFARQLRLWREAGRPIGHRVIIFLGTNDILNTDTFDASYTATGEGSPS